MNTQIKKTKHDIAVDLCAEHRDAARRADEKLKLARLELQKTLQDHRTKPRVLSGQNEGARKYIREANTIMLDSKKRAKKLRGEEE